MVTSDRKREPRRGRRYRACGLRAAVPADDDMLTGACNGDRRRHDNGPTAFQQQRFEVFARG